MAEAAITEEQFNAAAERVIVAIDVATEQEAANLIVGLPKTRIIKLGIEAMMAGVAHRALAWAQAQGKKVFWDGKFLDIKNTVVGAAKALPEGVALFNLHAFAGNDTMLKAAGIARDRGMQAIAVTVLTDKTHQDLVNLGLAKSYWDPTSSRRTSAENDARATEYENGNMQKLVARLATLAYGAGMHGVVCSPQELSVLRAAFPKDFLLVTPGIRPIWAAANDQKRITTPADAGRAGADYIVVGRPITAPPEGLSPADAFDRIVEEFAAGIAARRP